LAAAGIPEAVAREVARVRLAVDPEGELARLAQLQVSAITLLEPEYPTWLQHIQSPPAVLYVRGSLEPQDELALAVVGTRRATRYGLEVTRRIVPELVRAGVTIVSGLALGIDGAAHQAALDAGGRTLAVMACGVDVVYPREHRLLARAISENGALLSEYPPGVQPDARNFPPRNRIISGLSRGVLVVEAGEKSGALITAQFALEQGRETFAIPGSVFSCQSRGTNGLIQRGEAKLVLSADDILEELALQRSAAQLEMRLAMPVDDLEKQVLSAVSAEPLHIDELSRTLGMPVAALSSVLMTLELKGLVHSSGQFYSAIT
jgi:DNA processing protein